MHESIRPLATIVSLNTRLFLNCLEEVNDRIAILRPNEKTNNLAFIALHLLDSRYYLGQHIGLTARNPYATEMESVRSVKDLKTVPPLVDVKKHWQEISQLLLDGLAGLTEEDLQRRSTMQFPVDDHTLLGPIAFLVQHESYHIGQMALLRTYSYLPPMHY